VFWLTLTALLLLVTVVATTLIFNIPINTDQLTWNMQTPPPDWRGCVITGQIRHVHAVRTGAALLAFGCLSVAAMGASLTTRRRHARTAGRSESRGIPMSSVFTTGTVRSYAALISR